VVAGPDVVVGASRAPSGARAGKGAAAGAWPSGARPARARRTSSTRAAPRAPASPDTRGPGENGHLLGTGSGARAFWSTPAARARGGEGAAARGALPATRSGARSHAAKVPGLPRADAPTPPAPGSSRGVLAPRAIERCSSTASAATNRAQVAQPPAATSPRQAAGVGGTRAPRRRSSRAPDDRACQGAPPQATSAAGAPARSTPRRAARPAAGAAPRRKARRRPAQAATLSPEPSWRRGERGGVGRWGGE
jgi:hypothetical protein